MRARAAQIPLSPTSKLASSASSPFASGSNSCCVHTPQPTATSPHIERCSIQFARHRSASLASDSHSLFVLAKKNSNPQTVSIVRRPQDAAYHSFNTLFSSPIAYKAIFIAHNHPSLILSNLLPPLSGRRRKKRCVCRDRVCYYLLSDFDVSASDSSWLVLL